MHDERRLPDRYRPVIVPSGRYCAQDSELGELVVRHVELCEHCVHGEVPISGYDYYYKTDLTRPSPRLVPMAAAVARRVAFVISSLPPLSRFPPNDNSKHVMCVPLACAESVYYCSIVREAVNPCTRVSKNAVLVTSRA